MKLFYIANIRIPTEKAHGRQIAKMCEAFANVGVDLELIVPTRKGALSEEDPYSYYGIRSNFQITKLKTLDPVFLLKFINGTYIKVQTLLFSFSLHKYLKINKADLIYTRDFYLLPFIRGGAEKIIWEVHDLPRNKLKYVKYWNKFYKIIAITHGLKDELVRLGVEEVRIIVAPDAVDLGQFIGITDSKEDLRKELDLPLKKNIVMYSGHLYGWKGADVLALTAKKLTNHEQIVILGGTDKDIVKFKQDFGSIKNLSIIGRKSFGQVVKYLKSADILILPNSAKSKISSHYTSPMKLFEYMAAGKPIVASSLPSILEILNKNNAVLVEPDNVQSLADGINKVLGNDDLAKEISEHAYTDVMQYSWDQRTNNILRSLRE